MTCIKLGILASPDISVHVNRESIKLHLKHNKHNKYISPFSPKVLSLRFQILCYVIHRNLSVACGSSLATRDLLYQGGFVWWCH